MGINDDQGGENNQDITEEMDAYYQTENKSNNGTAILYGVFALVVTLIVAAGLFFGGRAIYRALTGTSGGNETAVEQEGQNTTVNNENTQETDNSQGQTPGVSSDTPNGSTDSEDDQTSGNGSAGSMPSTGDNLPATGSPTGI